MLPVDFHERPAELPQKRGRNRPVIDESLCAPILVLDAPQDQHVLAIDRLLAKETVRRM